MELSDTSRYVPKTSLWHNLITTGMFQRQTYGITLISTGILQKQANGTTLIATGMFQKQAYVITWYQQVCSKNKPMALPW